MGRDEIIASYEDSFKKLDLYQRIASLPRVFVAMRNEEFEESDQAGCVEELLDLLNPKKKPGLNNHLLPIIAYHLKHIMVTMPEKKEEKKKEAEKPEIEENENVVVDASSALKPEDMADTKHDKDIMDMLGIGNAERPWEDDE